MFKAEKENDDLSQWNVKFVKTLTERNLDTLSSTKRMWGVEEQNV